MSKSTIAAVVVLVLAVMLGASSESESASADNVGPEAELSEVAEAAGDDGDGSSVVQCNCSCWAGNNVDPEKRWVDKTVGCGSLNGEACTLTRGDGVLQGTLKSCLPAP